MTSINNNLNIQPNIAQKSTSKDKKYNDPLNSWNIKWMSYTNEIGTSINEIAPKFGAFLWIPSFMYIGADVYDKYKNDKDSYSPSSKRAFERAVYQGISNLFALPLLISAGQKLVSPLSLLSGDKISSNKKEAIYKHINLVMQQGTGKELDNEKSLENFLRTTLDNKISSKKSEYKNANIFKKVWGILNNNYTLAYGDKEKLLNFAQKQAKELYEIKTSLQKGQTSPKISSKVLETYNSTLKTMNEMHGFDYANNAVRSALIKVGNEHIFKNKIIKTLGGLTALFTLGSVVTKYIEKKLVGKYLDNGLDFAYHNVIQNSNIKNIFEELKNNKTPYKTEPNNSSNSVKP